MNTTGNTILITGGNAGIGLGLAEAFCGLGNTVIITGRRKDRLEAAAAKNPGMIPYVLDVDDMGALEAFAAAVVAAHPGLNVLVNNAGVAGSETLSAGEVPLALAESIVTTNILGPVRLTALLLPHLLGRPAAVVNVGSGLAHVPLAALPTYSASKAFIHSYTQSLRQQLRGTPVEVLELIPPLVQTGLGGADPDREPSPHVMPLAAYIAEVMELFGRQPTPPEIVVERAKRLRFAEASGSYEAVFRERNPRSGHPL